MKIDKVTFEAMRRSMQTTYTHLCTMRPANSNIEFTDSLLNELWYLTWMSIAYESSNPNVLCNDQGRLFCHNPQAELYPCGTDDVTLTTALRRIGKTLSGAPDNRRLSS